MSRALSTPVVDAITAFREGDPVLIHDAADREGETDILFPAGAVGPREVAQLRNDAGGLICVALSAGVADAFDLPFMQDILDHPAARDHTLSYDDRSSFSLTVNHRDTRTGVTDHDRALTIRELGRAATAPADFPFADTFRCPGHVHLLRSAEDLLASREGHTELGVALAEAADLPSAVVLCEMLADETGEALLPDQAKAYAARHNAPYVEGNELVETLL